jgi:hypothetical protein
MSGLQRKKRSKEFLRSDDGVIPEILKDRISIPVHIFLLTLL